MNKKRQFFQQLFFLKSFFVLAYILQQKGNEKEAQECYAKALELSSHKH